MSDPTTISDNDPLARPDWACALHSPPRQVGAWIPADQGFATCSTCDTGLRERLDDVARRYLQLDSRPGGTGEYGSRGAPGFGSRPPCNLHVVALQDPRSSRDARVWLARDGRVHRESERPPLSVHGILSCQSWAVAEHRGIEGPGDRSDVFELLRWIARNIEYVTRHGELVVEVDRAVRDLQGQLRPMTGDARRRIGLCPAELDVVLGVEAGGDGVTVSQQVCGSALFAPVNGADAIDCFTCNAHWDRTDWLRLGDLLQHAA